MFEIKNTQLKSVLFRVTSSFTEKTLVHIVVFGDMTTSCLVGGYQVIGGTSYLNVQDCLKMEFKEFSLAVGCV
jgi:hypothetical protein